MPGPSAKKPKAKALESYRNKRDANRTPEPFGSVRSGGGPLEFVVQKHAARRLHFDFRLQLGNVLLSWAVPKGPSLDPKAKRFAVHVEDHPLEYANFEGVIPDGNYGAGSVIVWDRGVWKPTGDPREGYDNGDLKFELFGYKLRGEYALVRTTGRGKGKDPHGTQGGGDQSHWLLLKKGDAFATEAELGQESILSGLLVEELASSRERVGKLREVLESQGAAPSRVDPRKVRLALCQIGEKAFSSPDWIFELKYDGYRVIAAKRDGEPILRYRCGHDVTSSFPGIAAALRALPAQVITLDGELVCFDNRGRSDFSRLQRRALLTRKSDVGRARIELPATVVAFDLLSLEGLDTRSLALEVRKEILSQLVSRTGVVRFADHIDGLGEELYAKITEMGLEGMVAKRKGQPYRSGRHPDWLKLRLSYTDDFAIVGYRLSKKNTRTGFGALHLAIHDDGQWIYAGRVGSGFDEKELTAIRDALDGLEHREYGFEADVATRDTWVEPKFVCEVRYKEWPKSRTHVREPSFLRLRHDKKPTDCGRPEVHGDGPREPPTVLDDETERKVVVTNRDKVFWPDAGFSKGDLIDYYEAISPWLLPYLADRPLVLTRYPDGITGKSFYQKDAPTWAPDWIRTRTVWSNHSKREIHYFIADSIEVLSYLANMGTIPFHVWCSRAQDLARPDWSIIDLDPKGAPFKDVVAIARWIGKLLNEIELPAYLKTSGSTGLHILIPLGGQCTFEQSRQLAGLIAQLVIESHPKIATIARAIDSRDGRVYVDFLQNRQGQLLVAPFSVRPLAGAPVSMPLEWSELSTRNTNERHTIKSAVRRMKRLHQDPMAAVLTDRPILLDALERLSERIAL